MQGNLMEKGNQKEETEEIKILKLILLNPDTAFSIVIKKLVPMI